MKTENSCLGMDLSFLFGNTRILKLPDIEMKTAAAIAKVEKGIEPPSDLVSACNLLGVVKTFQDDCLQVGFP